MFHGLDVYHTYPAQHLVAAGWVLVNVRRVQSCFCAATCRLPVFVVGVHDGEVFVFFCVGNCHARTYFYDCCILAET